MVVTVSLQKVELEELLANHFRKSIPALKEVRVQAIANAANGCLEKMTLCITMNQEEPKK